MHAASQRTIDAEYWEYFVIDLAICALYAIFFSFPFSHLYSMLFTVQYLSEYWE
jgi:hypothetical protein